MARVKGIGELDWDMYGIDDFDGDRSEGAVFGSNQAIWLNSDSFATTIFATSTFQLCFRLVPDRRTLLHLNTREVLDLDAVPPSASVYSYDDIDQTSSLDLEPLVLTKGIVHLFSAVSSKLKVRGVCASVYRPGLVGIDFDLIVNEAPIFPDKYLHALARKMSKWAKE